MVEGVSKRLIPVGQMLPGGHRFRLCLCSQAVGCRVSGDVWLSQAANPPLAGLIHMQAEAA